MESYSVYRRLKKIIKTATDEDVLKRLISSSEIMMGSISPRLRKIMELETRIRILQLRLSETNRVSERYRLGREISKLKEHMRREKLHDKARWDYMVQATKYSLLDARHLITDTIKGSARGLANGLAKFRKWVVESSPPSFTHLGTWALTSRELVEWSKKRIRKSVKKPKLKRVGASTKL